MPEELEQYIENLSAFPDRQEFDVYATMDPAKEMGGDFYDFFLVDADHLAVVGHPGRGYEYLRSRPGSLTLHTGDRLFQYTDGIPEAVNTALEAYGMERLQAVLRAHGKRPSAELLAAVKADVDRFAGGTPQFDDITMLCLEYKGNAGKP